MWEIVVEVLTAKQYISTPFIHSDHRNKTNTDLLKSEFNSILLALYVFNWMFTQQRPYAQQAVLTTSVRSKRSPTEQCIMNPLPWLVVLPNENVAPFGIINNVLLRLSVWSLCHKGWSANQLLRTSICCLVQGNFKWLLRIIPMIIVGIEVLVSNTRQTVFCYGVCEWWRTVLSFVQREGIQRREDQVLRSWNHLCTRLPSSEQHRLQGSQGKVKVKSHKGWRIGTCPN